MDATHPDAAQHPAQSRARGRDIVGWITDAKRRGDSGRRTARRDLYCLSRISLDRRRGQLEDIRQGF
jgi:hypothetical protein